MAAWLAASPRAAPEATRRGRLSAATFQQEAHQPVAAGTGDQHHQPPVTLIARPPGPANARWPAAPAGAHCPSGSASICSFTRSCSCHFNSSRRPAAASCDATSARVTCGATTEADRRTALTQNGGQATHSSASSRKTPGARPCAKARVAPQAQQHGGDAGVHRGDHGQRGRGVAQHEQAQRQRDEHRQPQQRDADARQAADARQPELAGGRLGQAPIELPAHARQRLPRRPGGWAARFLARDLPAVGAEGGPPAATRRAHQHQFVVAQQQQRRRGTGRWPAAPATPRR